MELQALPSRIGQVRRIVSAQLRYWHLDPLIDRAALGVTELLSNVHRHASPDKTCTVEIELRPDRLTVSVHDRDPRLPVVAEAEHDATTGRGLAMVAAMSESWGAHPDGDRGKVVWFSLPTTAQPQPVPVPVRPPHRPAEQETPVRRLTEAEHPVEQPAGHAAGHPAKVASEGRRPERAPVRSAVPG